MARPPGAEASTCRERLCGPRCHAGRRWGEPALAVAGRGPMQMLPTRERQYGPPGVGRYGVARDRKWTPACSQPASDSSRESS